MKGGLKLLYKVYIRNTKAFGENDQKTNSYIVEAVDEWEAIRKVEYKICNFSNWNIQSVEKSKYESPDDLANATRVSVGACVDAYKALSNQTKTVFDAVAKFRKRRDKTTYE